MKTSSISKQLTPDDKYQIEQLVDGELDESLRRDILTRLDSITGGWKFCALTFLEAQCLRETLKSPDFLSALSSDFLFQSAVSVPVGKKEPDSLSDTGSRTGKELKKTEESLKKEINGGMRDTSDEPYILPLKQGGYRRPGFRRRYSNGNGDGSGPTWRTVLFSMAGTFFIAVILTSLITLSVTTAPHSDTPASSAVKDTLLAQTEPEHSSSSPAETLKTESTPHKDAAQVQMVTLKSPKSGLNGIQIPCIESNHYDPGTLRPVQDNGDLYVEQLRQKGCQVEKVSKDLMFPMDDGRMLIVPVDTFNVRQHRPLENFQ